MEEKLYKKNEGVKKIILVNVRMKEQTTHQSGLIKLHHTSQK